MSQFKSPDRGFTDGSLPLRQGGTTIQSFKLVETDLGNGQAEIEVRGELDLAVAEQLRDAIDRAEAERVLISLASCEFIDSTGLAVIVRASQAEGRKLAVHSPSAQVLRVLDVTGLTGDGLVFEDREEALLACA